MTAGAYLNNNTMRRVPGAAKIGNETYKQHYIVLLVGLSIVLQYAMMFVYGGDSETVDPNSSTARYFSLINCVIYLVIASLEINHLKNWQLSLLVGGVAYLAVSTIIRGQGFVHMFTYVELLIAVIVFSQLRLSRKNVKHICLISVVAALFLFLTSRYENEYFVNSLFSVSLNRNHFCKLVIVNIYMALVYFRKYDRKIHLSYLIVYAVGLCIIIPTTSRTALACLILLILFHIASIKINKVNKKKLLRLFSLCLLVSLAAVFIVVYAMPNIFNEVQILGRSLLSGREKLYTDALDTLINNRSLLFGQGFEQFTQSVGHTGNMRTDVHNQWLQFALNYGLVFMVYMVIVYHKVFKSVIKKSFSIFTVFFILFQVLFFVYSLTETLYNLTMYACLLHVIYFTNSRPTNASKHNHCTKEYRRVKQ